MKEKIVVLGAGESGVGAAILAQKKGFDVFVSDLSGIKDKYKALLNEYEINWEEGKHTESLILDAKEVIKSPGIPDKAPLIKKLKENAVPVISEIEFASRYTNAKMICITGSNGKTITTMLIYHLLKSAGLNVGLAGNVGNSLALQVANELYDYYVVELSSFQLDGMYDFRADIAILLNITPDHMDRYEYKMQNYVNSKFRITQNQTENDAFIYWNDDPIIKEEIKKRTIKACLYPFSEMKQAGVKAWTENGQMVVETLKHTFKMEQDLLALTGKHNLYNSMASAITGNVVEIKDKNIRESLSDFKGVPHRLEYVATIRGIKFINDSKATNVNSCWYALQSMITPVVLILGGTDKGNDYTEIQPLVKEKVKAMVYLGVDNSKLHAFFDKKVSLHADAGSMEEAVRKAYEFAGKGDTVLLSPCCASFDLFKNYEDRGDQFREYVKKL